MKTTSIAALCLLMTGATVANAAMISPGNPNAPGVLDGDLFLTEASTGQADTAFPPPAFFNPQRTFDIDGMSGPPGVPGTVTIQGFGFATNASTTQNTAPTVDLTFIYLGDDEVVSADDEVIGTETIDWASGWSGAGLYFVNLDTDPSLFIDGQGERFRITITPNGGPIRLKQAPNIGIKLTVSGTFTPVPEPASAGMGVAAIALAAFRRRR